MKRIVFVSIEKAASEEVPLIKSNHDDVAPVAADPGTAALVHHTLLMAHGIDNHGPFHHKRDTTTAHWLLPGGDTTAHFHDNPTTGHALSGAMALQGAGVHDETQSVGQAIGRHAGAAALTVHKGGKVAATFHSPPSHEQLGKLAELANHHGAGFEYHLFHPETGSKLGEGVSVGDLSREPFVQKWGGGSGDPMERAGHYARRIEAHTAELSKAVDDKKKGVKASCNRCLKVGVWTGEDCPHCGASLEMGEIVKALAGEKPVIGLHGTASKSAAAIAKQGFRSRVRSGYSSFGSDESDDLTSVVPGGYVYAGKSPQQPVALSHQGSRRSQDHAIVVTHTHPSECHADEDFSNEHLHDWKKIHGVENPSVMANPDGKLLPHDHPLFDPAEKHLDKLQSLPHWKHLDPDRALGLAKQAREYAHYSYAQSYIGNNGGWKKGQDNRQFAIVARKDAAEKEVRDHYAASGDNNLKYAVANARSGGFMSHSQKLKAAHMAGGVASHRGMGTFVVPEDRPDMVHSTITFPRIKGESRDDWDKRVEPLHKVLQQHMGGHPDDMANAVSQLPGFTVTHNPKYKAPGGEIVKALGGTAEHTANIPTIRSVEELSDLVRHHEENGKSLFVRHSHGPEDDAKRGWLSRNWDTEEHEPGLSCYAMHDPEDSWGDHKELEKYSPGMLSHHPDMMQSNLTLHPRSKDQVTYLMHGEKVGEGSDYESVIKNVKPVAYVHPELHALAESGKMADHHIPRIAALEAAAEKRPRHWDCPNCANRCPIMAPKCFCGHERPPVADEPVQKAVDKKDKATVGMSFDAPPEPAAPEFIAGETVRHKSSGRVGLVAGPKEDSPNYLVRHKDGYLNEHHPNELEKVEPAAPIPAPHDVPIMNGQVVVHIPSGRDFHAKRRYTITRGRPTESLTPDSIHHEYDGVHNDGKRAIYPHEELGFKEQKHLDFARQHHQQNEAIKAIHSKDGLFGLPGGTAAPAHSSSSVVHPGDVPFPRDSHAFHPGKGKDFHIDHVVKLQPGKFAANGGDPSKTQYRYEGKFPGGNRISIPHDELRFHNQNDYENARAHHEDTQLREALSDDGGGMFAFHKAIDKKDGGTGSLVNEGLEGYVGINYGVKAARSSIERLRVPNHRAYAHAFLDHVVANHHAQLSPINPHISNLEVLGSRCGNSHAIQEHVYNYLLDPATRQAQHDIETEHHFNRLADHTEALKTARGGQILHHRHEIKKQQFHINIMGQRQEKLHKERAAWEKRGAPASDFIPDHLRTVRGGDELGVFRNQDAPIEHDPAERPLMKGLRLVFVKAINKTGGSANLAMDFGETHGDAPKPIQLGHIPSPKLADYDKILVNSSGGKDSQAMLDHICTKAKAEGVLHRVHVVHADLGDVEWKGTKEIAEKQAAHYGVPFHVVSHPQGDLLDAVVRKGKFPGSATRWCTAEHKRNQVSKLMTKFADEHRAAGGGKIRILNCMGLRAAESSSRAKLTPFKNDEMQTNGRRHVDTYLPIHHWSKEKVWDTIHKSGAPYHYAYDLGMPRLSCPFCFFQPKQALMLAGKHNPELLERYAKVEEQTGHTLKHGESLRDIQAALKRGEEPGEIKTWEG